MDKPTDYQVDEKCFIPLSISHRLVISCSHLAFGFRHHQYCCNHESQQLNLLLLPDPCYPSSPSFVSLSSCIISASYNILQQYLFSAMLRSRRKTFTHARKTVARAGCSRRQLPKLHSINMIFRTTVKKSQTSGLNDERSKPHQSSSQLHGGKPAQPWVIRGGITQWSFETLTLSAR